MIIFHIAANILFWLFLILAINRGRQCIKTLKYSRFIIATGILGIIAYALYLIMLLANFKETGFDNQSFTILVLSWAFENASYCIMNKRNDVKL